jgi:hypothetical protein
MERNEIIQYALQTDIINKWHYFQYHFNFYFKGYEHVLCKSIIDACLSCEKVLTNVGKTFIDRIAAINGKERFIPHYEQLLQTLAELLIVEKSLSHNWGPETVFAHEPITSVSKKNPEINICTKGITIGIEVKCPQLIEHARNRGARSVQLPSRSSLVEYYAKDNITLPRDNPIKDFLASADEKFKPFKSLDPNYYGVLVIVYDDFIVEPISALLSETSGLFTLKSFAANKDGTIRKFENVDCVIITRHLLPIMRGTRDEPMSDFFVHPLDYGERDLFPFKVHIPNPFTGSRVLDSVADCFQTYTLSPELGAEYVPSQHINWLAQ